MCYMYNTLMFDTLALHLIAPKFVWSNVFIIFAYFHELYYNF